MIKVPFKDISRNSQINRIFDFITTKNLLVGCVEGNEEIVTGNFSVPIPWVRGFLGKALLL